MKLLSVDVENYRQYQGKQSIDFSTDPEKNMTVIEGVNGSGKTNFLNAIAWCLYGKETNFRTVKEKGQQILNDYAADKLKPNQQVETKVVLHAIDTATNKPVRFERSVGFFKNRNGQLSQGEPKFEVYLQIGRDMQLITTPAYLVNRILPEEIKNFFFFDGEKLDEFFKEENAEKVKQAISDISQLSLLDTVIDHLEKTLYEIRSGIKGQSPMVQDIQEKIRLLTQSKDNMAAEKKGHEETLETARNDLRKVEDKLKNVNVSSAKALQKEREKLTSDLNSRQGELDERLEEMNERIIRAVPMVYGYNALKYSLDKIGEKREKGVLPPNIRTVFIRELLEKGECICGSDISKEGKQRKKVFALLEKESYSEVSDYIGKGSYEINGIIEELESVVNQFNLTGKHITELESKKQKIEDRLREIQTELKGIDSTEVTNLEFNRNTFVRNIEKLVADIAVLEIKIKGAEQQIETYGKDLQKELAKSTQYAFVNKELATGDQVLALYRKIRGNLIDKLRKTIEEKTKDYFLSLIWKKNTYSDVSIDESYNVDVINTLGLECLATLSAGERQVLALSFMAALRVVSGFEAPVIIDTPLGRISGEPKENIAKLIPQYLKNVQVTLLVTDQEYTPAIKKILSKNVGKAYWLEYDEGESKTYVRNHEK